MKAYGFTEKATWNIDFSQVNVCIVLCVCMYIFCVRVYVCVCTCVCVCLCTCMCSTVVFRVLPTLVGSGSK